MSRLALGTAQFGLPYGIANSAGQVDTDEIAAILDVRARRGGIDTLDTAIAYGDSEQRLGEVGVGEWRVITKLPPLPADVRGRGGAGCETALRGSLQRLDWPRLHALLLHRAQRSRWTRSGSGARDALPRLKAGRIVRTIGVSIYDPEELDSLWSRVAARRRAGAVQRRWTGASTRSGWLARLAAAGTEVHVRSVFLQGLLLMPAPARPARFARWRRAVATAGTRGWREQAAAPLQACLGFALSHPGSRPRWSSASTSPQHLQEILRPTRRHAVRLPTS